MTGEQFRDWLDAMKAKGYNKGDCAEMLGRGKQWVSDAQTKGVDRAIALACAALLAGLKPYQGKRKATSTAA